MRWLARIILAGAPLSPALLCAFAGAARAAIHYSTNPVDLDEQKLDVRINVLTLERRDESEDGSSMECLNKRAIKLTLPTATQFLIEELRASAAYRDVALSSGVDWVRTGEILVQGTIGRLGQQSSGNYLGVMHWKVTIPSSNRVLWEGYTQGEAEKDGVLLNLYTARVCSELLRQNFWQLREELSTILPRELEFKDTRSRPRVKRRDPEDI